MMIHNIHNTDMATMEAMSKEEKCEHLEIEPIDYAKITSLPPHLKDMQVAPKKESFPTTLPMTSIPPITASVTVAPPLIPPTRKNPGKLLPFKQLGPGYESVVKLVGTEVLLKPYANGTYQILGTFAPHLQSLFRPLNEKEERAVKESGIVCVK